jgi:hypothetical protein
MKTVQPGSKAYTVKGLLPLCRFGYMKLCYADPELKVSKEEFERPANLYKSRTVILLWLSKDDCCSKQR